MLFDPSIFYTTYLDDYHQFKAITLKRILEDVEKYDKEFFSWNETGETREAYKKTLQADLRQTYFHAIETFFELFFCLNPTDKMFMGDLNVMIALTKSDWRKSYKKIKEIATDEKGLDFLDQEIEMHNVKVSAAHYIFYFGLAENQKKDEAFADKLKSSLGAIKFGIRLIARDFIDREEYNSYKHGLRIIPALKNISLVDLISMKTHITWNLEESMSFFVRTKSDDEAKVVTKVFDTERDYQMTYFCSNLISNMIYYRKLAFDKKKKPTDIMIMRFFGKDQISKCDTINVEIQNLVYTVKKVNEK